jgi:hypothetical protein
MRSSNRRQSWTNSAIRLTILGERLYLRLGCAISGRLLLRYEPQPGAEVTSLCEACAIADRRHHGILGKISKRGNKYLRTLFVQAAHVVLARRPTAAMRSLWPWIKQGGSAEDLHNLSE